MTFSARRPALIIGLAIVAASLTGRTHHRVRPVSAAPSEAYRLADTWLSDPSAAPPDAFREPRGATVDVFERTVYLVDGGNERVQVFAEDGTFVRTIGGPGAPPEGLAAPRDVAVQGSLVFVTDHGHDRVAVFTVDGTFVTDWPGLAGPWGIAVGQDGRVFVSENGADQVAVFRTDGVRLATWGRFGTAVGGLVGPRGADVTPTGRLVVADYGNERLVMVAPDGSFERASLPGALPEPPTDVVSDPTGGFVVVLDGASVARLEDQADLPLSAAPDPLPGAVGVAAAPGPDAHVFVTFQDDGLPFHGVARFTGRPLRPAGRWGGVPAPLGRLDAPFRLAAADVALVVDDWRRVQTFGPDGTALSQAAVGLVNDVAPGPGGDLFVARDGAVARVDRDGSPIWIWDVPVSAGGYGWVVALDYDPATDRLSVLDIGEQRLRLLTGAGAPVGDPSFRPGPGLFTSLWDVARAPGGGMYTVNRSADTVELRSAATATVDRWWPVPGGPTRLTSDGAGNVFVLNRSGWLWKYAPDGDLLAVWRVGDAADRLSDPVDVAVDAGGRVLVVDRGLERIEVWEPDPDGTPGTVPALDPACSAVGQKQAEPTQLVLGDETTITLRVGGTCPAVRSPADVALVIDHSGSMGVQEKMETAQAAARAFVDVVDPGQIMLSVVRFNQDAAVVQPLTGNFAAARQAIEALRAGGGTDIAAGVDAARIELTGPRRRPEARPVLVLLTDGGSDPNAALRAADLAKTEGLRLFTIGFGVGANVTLLESMASSPDDYYFAPSNDELVDVYLAIATRIAADVLFATLEITDELPANMAYVPGSGQPPPIVAGSTLVWRLSDVPLSGLELRYRVLPLEVGTWPTNVLAVGDGTDGLGQRGRVDFPVPEVIVVAPTATPPPTPPPTSTPPPPPSATPTATASPSPTLPPPPIYLPIARREVCVAGRRHVDAVLVVDTSGSMLDLTRTGRRKLDAAAEAVGTFVELLDLDHDGAAIVAFNSQASVVQELSHDGEQLRAAIARLPQSPGTRIDLGLTAALDALAGPGRRPANLPVVILLTDGRPTGTTPEAVLAAAAVLKADPSLLLYAIGLGDDVDADLLARVATSGSHVLLAPDAEDLARLYGEIAIELPCIRP